jgi:hypothetical protein
MTESTDREHDRFRSTSRPTTGIHFSHRPYNINLR